MDNSTLAILIFCFNASIVIAEEFHSRPALKLLIQKLCYLANGAINLFKIVIVCESSKLLIFYKILSNNESDDETQQYSMKLVLSIINKNFLILKKLEKSLLKKKFIDLVRNLYKSVFNLIKYKFYSLCNIYLWRVL